MTNKKVYSKLNEGDVINTCWICGRQFLAKGIMTDPICPKCEETRVKRNVSNTGSAQEEWIRIPKVACPPNTGSNVKNPLAPTEVDWEKVREQLEVDSPTQTSIRIITNAMQDLLLYKNKKYGDSAINPLGVFTKHIKHVEANTASILVRLDDKLSRVKNADELRVNDVADIMGYCTLLLISMGVTEEDIAKFKD